MKCKECTACRINSIKRWVNGQWVTIESNWCFGVKHPFEIEDINAECTEYEEKKGKPAPKEVKHFHNTEMKCSAEVVNWVTLDKLSDASADFFKFLGVYKDDSDSGFYAMFGDFPKRYVIPIKI